MNLASWVLVGGAAGLRAREFDYWILGRPRTQATPCWSVVRDVLHWRNLGREEEYRWRD